MSFSINTNVTSLQAQNNLRASSDFQSKTINRVTSGLRIVNSGDDAAGLAIANGMRSDQAVLTQGIRNAGDALSTLQTIDGGMNNISMLLDRARTLAAQSASGTFAGGDQGRATLNSEFQNVMTEITRQSTAIGMNTSGVFNQNLSVFIGGGKDGSATGGTANALAVATGSVNVDLRASAVDTSALGLSTVTTTPAASAVLGTINGATSGGAAIMKFVGAGYGTGVSVAVSGLDTATSLSAVVTDINAAIATAGNTNAAFKTASITAQLSSDGTKVVFSGTSAFSVSDATTGDTAGNTAAVRNIIGTASTGLAKVAQGSKQVALNFGDAVTTAVQDLTFSATDPTTGAVQSIQLAMAIGSTKAGMVATINTALQAAGGALGKLVAVDDANLAATTTGGVTIMGSGSFGVLTSAGTASDGFVAASALALNTQSATVGTGGAVDISNATTATAAVNALANAVNTLGNAQAVVGKGENQFNYAMNLAQSQSTNLAAAESRIRDADLASEAANLTKAQILLQAGTAALAQANSAPQAILSLLKG
ncbi:MAG: flagellin [Candidatus Solibacter sp.]